VHERHKVCMARVTVETSTGDLSNGEAFHIGDGWFVTAAHVLEDNKLVEVVGHFLDRPIQVRRTMRSPDPRVDLALMETDFDLEHYMARVHFHGIRDDWKTDHIPLGDHLDDWIGEELILTSVLLMGYPPLPFVREPA
jgi:hypothetical protein